MTITRSIPRSILSPLTRAVTAGGGGYSPPAANYYVSNEATYGYVIGSDTNDGLTKATAFLTIEKAITTATAGQSIVVNGATHTATTYFNLTKSVNLYPQTFRGTTLRSPSGQSQVILIDLPGSTSSAIGPFVIDGQSHAAKRCVALGNAANFTLAFNRTKFLNWTTNAIRSTPPSTKFNLTCSGIDLTAAAAGSSAIFAASMIQGSLTVTGASCNITANVTNSGVVDIVGNSVGYIGVTVNISGIVGTVTQNVVGGNYWGVKAYNIPGVVVESCDVTVTGTSWGYGAWISADPASPRDASNAVVRRNRFRVLTPNGVIVLIGQDTSGAANGLCNNAEVYDNDISSDLAGSAGTHGIEIGWVSGGNVYRNRCAFGYVGVLAKGTTGTTTFYNNLIRDCGTASSMRAKAATGARFYNNTVYISGGSGGYGIYVGGDTTVTTPTTDCVFANNIIFAATSITDLVFVTAAEAGPTAASAATFNNNLYYASVAIPGSPYSYQGTTYTLAAWQAAKEATAISGNPLFADTVDFRPGAGSPATGAGATGLGVTSDFFQTTRATPPSIGAVEGA